MGKKYYIEQMEKNFALKQELDKNKKLKDQLVQARASLSDDTFSKYFSIYTNNINELEAEINPIEQIIDEIKFSFEQRKLDIDNKILKLEKLIEDTNMLYSSNAIDKHEYKKRKIENTLYLNSIEKENKILIFEMNEFEKLLSKKTLHKKFNSKPNRYNKKIILVIVGIVLIILISAIFALSFFKRYSNRDFESISSSYRRRYPVRVEIVDNGFLYGFTDERGIIVIETQFDDVDPFSEGYAAVKKNGLWGYINDSGEVVIDYQYRLKEPSSFSDGLVSIFSNNKYGYIDTEGNTIIAFEYDGARDFRYNLAPVKKGDKWGYIDRSNKVVIDFIYDNAYSFSDDAIASVRVGGKEGFINIEGVYIVEPIYDDVKPYSDGMAAVKRYGSWGYIDTNGFALIDSTYNNANNFDGGFAVVEYDGNFSIIDALGNNRLNILNYAKVINLGSSMFSITDDNKLWQLLDVDGYIKINNNITIAPIEMYGDGAIFSIKTPYGYSLYDYSFSHIMNYYYPYTGVYRYESRSVEEGESNNYYFFIWYKDSVKEYYGFCVYIDDYNNMYDFIDYGRLHITNSSFAVEEITIMTNFNYDFYTGIYMAKPFTNINKYNVNIEGDMLVLGDAYFNRVYTFENTNSMNILYSNQMNLY